MKSFLRLGCLLVIMLIICNLLLTGCNSDKKENKTEEVVETKTIDYWIIDWSAEYNKLTQVAIDKFNSSQKKVKVNLTPTAWSGGMTAYDDKLLPAIAAGTPPDVIMTASIMNPLQNDIIEDFSDLIEKDKTFNMNIYYPYKIEQCTYNNLIYALPYEFTVEGVLIYNKSMFKRAGLDPNKPPKTIAELDSMAEKMTVTNSDGLYSQIGFYPWDGLMIQSHFRGPFGASYMDENGKVTPNNPNNIKSLEWALTYVKKYGYEKINTSLQKSNAWGNAFLKGVLGMEYGYNGQILQLLKENVDFEWDISKFPTENSSINPISGGGWMTAIPFGSKNREASYEFMKWYCGEEGQTLICKDYKQLWGFSPVIKVAEKYKKDMPAQLTYFVDSLLPTMKAPKNVIGGHPQYNNFLNDAMNTILQQKGEPKAVLDDLDRKMKTLIKQ